MKLESILTRRNFELTHSFDLIYEWEDIMSAVLSLPLSYEKKNLCGKCGRRMPLAFKLLMEKKDFFYYDMFADLSIHRNRNLKNIVPCIIDFYCNIKELNTFERNYSKNPIVFISSREAFDFLKEHDCQLNIAHLPLSLSDIYSNKMTQDKVYDIAVIGRRNPVLMDYLDEYKEKHEDLKIVMNSTVDGRRSFCLSDKTFISENTRANYFDILSKTKTVFYHTPGMDGGEERTKGFNQVTPRFLEGIACGCHVISRYRANSDTEFYDFQHMTSNIQSYEQFEKEMDCALQEPIDRVKYQNYIKKHVTSNVADELKKYI